MGKSPNAGAVKMDWDLPLPVSLMRRSHPGKTQLDLSTRGDPVSLPAQLPSVGKTQLEQGRDMWENLQVTPM